MSARSFAQALERSDELERCAKALFADPNELDWPVCRDLERSFAAACDTLQRKHEQFCSTEGWGVFVVPPFGQDTKGRWPEVCSVKVQQRGYRHLVFWHPAAAPDADGSRSHPSGCAADAPHRGPWGTKVTPLGWHDDMCGRACCLDAGAGASFGYSGLQTVDARFCRCWR